MKRATVWEFSYEEMEVLHRGLQMYIQNMFDEPRDWNPDEYLMATELSGELSGELYG